MTVIIVFPDDTDLVMSNRYYRQLAEDIGTVAPDDATLNLEIEIGGVNQLLSLDDIDRDLRNRIMRAMRVVAGQTLAGAMPGWQRDESEDYEGQNAEFARIHLEVLAKLDRKIDRFLPPDPGGVRARLRRFRIRLGPTVRGCLRDMMWSTRVGRGIVMRLRM